MTDDKARQPEPPATTTIASPEIDTQSGAIGTGPGYSGQEYDAQDFAIERALNKSAEGPRSAPDDEDPRFPPDNGRRAFFDERTGEVHGSGAGAGGGNPGEDFASDPAAGDGYPQTGRGSVPRR
ncbi:MAG: hypothetical protein ACTHJR_03790 [Sphingomonas sp.]|uniref:hypothetical protein n=1 Tax=Sphingomonas sp. TaxID=28214 RepID=UPI003F811133